MYKSLLISICIMMVNTANLWGHAPFLEEDDYSFAEPFSINGSVEKSIAVYAWLESETDVDVYTFTLKKPQRLYIKIIVPVCAVYEYFYPCFAVIGPGIEGSVTDLAFEIPSGTGVEIVTQTESDPSQRATFYEPFGMKSYYDGAVFERTIDEEGTWHIAVWDQTGMSGDYVATIGFKERFSIADVFRSFYIVPKIWMDKELHNTCE